MHSSVEVDRILSVSVDGRDILVRHGGLLLSISLIKVVHYVNIRSFFMIIIKIFAHVFTYRRNNHSFFVSFELY